MVEGIGYEISHKIHEKMHKGGHHLEIDNDFTAQFAAGVAYGVSGRTVDYRDYLVGCMVESKPLTNKLSKAFEKYNAAENYRGSKKMARAEEFWRVAMADCPDSNPWFDQFATDAHTFLARDD